MLKGLAGIFLCCIVFPLCHAQNNITQKKKGAAIVFSVANSAVSSDEFMYLYRKNHQNKDEYTNAKIDEYLKLFIDFKLKVEEAKHRGMDTTTAFLKEYNSYRAELRKPYLPDNSLIDSLVLLTYNRMKEEVRASHILVALKKDPTPTDTLAAYRRIMVIRSHVTGGADFAAEATQNSEDPSAKINHGDLGYFSALQMVFPFETAAYTTSVGTVSLPVRTRFGYHLLKVTDRRPARGEVEVSHIMVRIRDDGDQERAKNLIFTIEDQLQAGVKWEELCKQYSEDPATKDQGGRLRPFGTGGMPGVPEFEMTAFDLQKPGDMSDPFKTQYGWHIIRMEKKIPLASYDAMASTLKAKVARDERTALSKQLLREKLEKRYAYNENGVVKTRVMADSSLRAGKRKLPATISPNELLFSLERRHFTVGDFLSHLKMNPRQQSDLPGKYLDTQYNNFVEASIMESVEKGIIAENPTYAYLLKEYYEGILLFEIMEKEVWNRASNDSTGQRKFYEANLPRYQAGDRSKAVIYSSSAGNGMEALVNLVKAGDERNIQEYIVAHKIKMEAGYFKRGEKDVFTKIPWSKGVYSAENKGMYYLAWLKDILPPGAMSFEEARPAIISDYQAHVEKIWLDQLKKKYPVKVNGKGKQHVIDTLQAK